MQFLDIRKPVTNDAVMKSAAAIRRRFHVHTATLADTRHAQTGADTRVVVGTDYKR